MTNIQIASLTKTIYSKDLYVNFIYKQRQEPADVRLHAGLEASGNQVTSFTTQRDRFINTQYHVSQEFILTGRK
jgi:hypothetical protein